MKVVVCGVGNVLCADEGVGVRVAEALMTDRRVPPHVEVVDGGTAGMALLPLLDGADHVVFVDAVELGAAPGTLFRLHAGEIGGVRADKASLHDITLGEVLSVAEVVGITPKVTVLGVQVADTSFRLDLSPEVQAAVPALAERVLAEVEALGA